MQKDRFDNYVAMFKHYAKQAEFDLTHLATIQLFAMGIENKLQDAILHRDTQPDTIEGYITAAQAEIQKYQNQQAIKFPGHAKFAWIGGHQPSTPWTFQPTYQPWNPVLRPMDYLHCLVLIFPHHVYHRTVFTGL
jgi:hypothetical protein